jgi:excisionase family DNA binding protein
MLRDDLVAGAKGAAQHTGLSERVIYGLVESGRLPTIRMGARLYFRKSALDAAFGSSSASA